MDSRRRTSRIVLTETSRLCFTVAACAFAAAVLGTVINHFLAGWMAVTGMFALSLLYAAFGLQSLRVKHDIAAETEESENVAEPAAVSEVVQQSAAQDPPVPPRELHPIAIRGQFQEL